MYSLNEEDRFTKQDMIEIYECLKNPRNTPYIGIGIAVFIGIHYMIYAF